jgi:hypothetical protein
VKKVHFKETKHLTLCGKHHSACEHPYAQHVLVGGLTRDWRYVTCKACKKYKERHPRR